jgi:hypothetical protein
MAETEESTPPDIPTTTKVIDYLDVIEEQIRTVFTFIPFLWAILERFSGNGARNCAKGQMSSTKLHERALALGRMQSFGIDGPPLAQLARARNGRQLNLALKTIMLRNFVRHPTASWCRQKTVKVRGVQPQCNHCVLEFIFH